MPTTSLSRPTAAPRTGPPPSLARAPRAWAPDPGRGLALLVATGLGIAVTACGGSVTTATPPVPPIAEAPPPPNASATTLYTFTTREAGPNGAPSPGPAGVRVWSDGRIESGTADGQGGTTWTFDRALTPEQLAQLQSTLRAIDASRLAEHLPSDRFAPEGAPEAAWTLQLAQGERRFVMTRFAGLHPSAFQPIVELLRAPTAQAGTVARWEAFGRGVAELSCNTRRSAWLSPIHDRLTDRDLPPAAEAPAGPASLQITWREAGVTWSAALHPGGADGGAGGVVVRVRADGTRDLRQLAAAEVSALTERIRAAPWSDPAALCKEGRPVSLQPVAAGADPG